MAGKEESWGMGCRAEVKGIRYRDHPWPPFRGLERELDTTPGERAIPSDDTLPRVWVSGFRRVG